MGSFTASLRSIGDVRALPATVELSDGRLSIIAGSTEIGSWPLDEIRLEEIPTGYRLAAEGDQILIELKDVESFASELAKRNKKRRLFGKDKTAAAKTTEMKTARPSPVVHRPVPGPVAGRAGAAVSPSETARPVREKRQKEPSGVAQKGIEVVDRVLAKTQKRFGPYLPDWLFSRAMFFIAITGLVAMVLLPGLFSVLLLLAGALLVLFGAIVYSDTVLASKWLPGRATPIQALLLGLSVLLFGVLLGIVTR
ncbi:MAG TPA: hypothetical protein VF148_09515 [Acidimicrobiia bacterium]